MSVWRGGAAGGLDDSMLPSIWTDANKGTRYLEPLADGTGVRVLATTAMRVGVRYVRVDSDTAVADLDTGVLTLGTDYYVYAVHEGASIGFVLSANTTVPAGYVPSESRKIGGFHYGRVRPLVHRYDRNAVLPVQVVPNSVWDLLYRPRTDPEGMCRVGDMWVDIYLASEDGTAWPETVPLSRYNAVPLTGTEGYSYFDMPRLARNAGKRLPTYAEWLELAWGVPEGATNAGARSATGGVDLLLPGGSPSSSAYYWVSCANVDQPSGNIWQVVDGYHDTSEVFGWRGVDAGRDSAPQGSVYDSQLRQLLAGGSWVNGSLAGARCALLLYQPWNVHTNVGLRCVSDSL